MDDLLAVDDEMQLFIKQLINDGFETTRTVNEYKAADPGKLTPPQHSGDVKDVCGGFTFDMKQKRRIHGCADCHNPGVVCKRPRVMYTYKSVR